MSGKLSWSILFVLHAIVVVAAEQRVGVAPAAVEGGCEDDERCSEGFVGEEVKDVGECRVVMLFAEEEEEACACDDAEGGDAEDGGDGFHIVLCFF